MTCLSCLQRKKKILCQYFLRLKTTCQIRTVTTSLLFISHCKNYKLFLKSLASLSQLHSRQHLQTGLIYEDNRVSHDKSSVEEDISCCVTMTSWKFTPHTSMVCTANISNVKTSFLLCTVSHCTVSGLQFVSHKCKQILSY